MTPPDSRRRAWVVVVAVPALLFVAVGHVLGPPRPTGAPPGRETRAAVVVRDAVDPMEKLATWAYVAPRLEAAYADVRCITERESFDVKASHAFQAALRETTAKFSRVDVFLLAHSNAYVGEVEGLKSLDSIRRIRFVYDSGCCDGRNAARWLALGVRTFVGHPETAAHAPFTYEFLRHWLARETVADATRASNEFTATLYQRLALFGDDEPGRLYARSLAQVHGAATTRVDDGP